MKNDTDIITKVSVVFISLLIRSITNTAYEEDRGDCF